MKSQMLPTIICNKVEIPKCVHLLCTNHVCNEYFGSFLQINNENKPIWFKPCLHHIHKNIDKHSKVQSKFIFALTKNTKQQNNANSCTIIIHRWMPKFMLLYSAFVIVQRSQFFFVNKLKQHSVIRESFHGFAASRTLFVKHYFKRKFHGCTLKIDTVSSLNHVEMRCTSSFEWKIRLDLWILAGADDIIFGRWYRNYYISSSN